MSRDDLRRKLGEAYRIAKFIAANRSSDIVIGEPHLESESLEFLQAALAGASRYLEYGSGGSTVLAHQHVECLVSVESDRRFLKAVEAALASRPSAAETILIPVNIGLTEAWGRPVLKKPTERRVKRWQAYPRAPWNVFTQRGVEPDLVFVDGRFRVACVLETVLRQRSDSFAPILFDDYVNRPHYSIVEKFADLVDTKGRMGVFRRKADLDREHCESVLAEFYADFR